MIVPAGSVSGVGARIAGGLLVLGAVLVLVASFLPLYSYSGAPGRPMTVISGWSNSSVTRSGTTSMSMPAGGAWLVAVATVAVAAAVTLFVTARRALTSGRACGALGAGMLAAGAAAQCLPAIDLLSILSSPDAVVQLGAGWILLILAAVCGLVGGIVAIAAGPRAAVARPNWPPPGQWGGPPQPWPLPTNGPQPTGPFPVQYPPPGPPRG